MKHFHNKRLNNYTYGEIELEDIGKCIIRSYEEPNTYPHFHIIGDNFETTISIFDCKYYDGHNRKIGILNQRQLEQLQNFLKDTDPDLKKVTNWRTIVVCWVGCNGEYLCPPGAGKLPNYKLLTPDKIIRKEKKK